jgi:endoglucanase
VSGFVRVNQVGYPSRCPKQAFAMLARPTGPLGFEVRRVRDGRVAFRGVTGRANGAFNSQWPAVYPLSFDGLRTPGRYVIALGALRSPPFRVGRGAPLYRSLAANAVSYLQSQRDGAHVIPGPLGRRPAHLHDRSAAVYVPPLRPTGGRRDASGGWFDAGDYLKFVQTSSFDDSLLLFALREYPGALPVDRVRAEARFGTDWLLRMWDGRRGVLYHQVGLGDGNGRTLLGDHDLWRLPQKDDGLPAGPGAPTRLLANRPVFAANAPGQRVSPNLAGRMAAAFALCAQDFAGSDPAYARRCVLAGRQVFAAADTSPRGPLVTATPHAYYPETEWRDDMALGAIELYLATKDKRYLPLAGHWADAYSSSRSSGADSLNLYDVSALADFELARVMRSSDYRALQRHPRNGVDLPTDPNSLIKDLRDSLDLGARLGAANPFGLSDVATNVDTVPHALGYAIQARLLDSLTRRTDYERLAETQLDWVLGANPWGSSFVVGAGSTFPHCLAHQAANLSGSLTGHGAILRGATVDGPTSLANAAVLGAPDGFRRCPPDGQDPFAQLRGRDTAYRDDVRSTYSSEPGNDYAMLALVAFAQQAQR